MSFFFYCGSLESSEFNGYRHLQHNAYYVVTWESDKDINQGGMIKSKQLGDSRTLEAVVQ